MTEENGLQPDLYRLANIQYPIPFQTAAPLEEGLLLKGDEGYYHLKKFKGESRELAMALEAKTYLHQQGFDWATSIVPLMNGGNQMEQDGKGYYMKEWHQSEKELPFRWQAQLGSELLAAIHRSGEGFKPSHPDQWEWPDWIKLFEMARDTIYDLHTKVVNTKESKLSKYFDRTAGEAIRSVEEAILHLKRAGYIDQRQEGMRQGFISLSRVPAPNLGMKFDLVEMVTPDLPACGLGTYLGQLGDWNQKKVINDVVDLLDVYHQIRPLRSYEIDLVKGFFKFPWQFWWVTEEYFLRAKDEEEKKIHKRYGKELKRVYKERNPEIRIALDEL